MRPRPTSVVFMVNTTVPSLPYPVVLGNDVPTLLDLIQSRSEHQITRERHVKGTGEAPEQQEQQEQQEPRPQPGSVTWSQLELRKQGTLWRVPFLS